MWRRRVVERARRRLSAWVASRRGVIALVREAVAVGPRQSVVVAVQIVAGGLLPIAVVLATGAMVAAIAAGADPWPALAALAAAVTLEAVVPPLGAPAVERLGHRVDGRARERTMVAALAPRSVGHLEEPVTGDEFRRAAGAGPTLIPGPYTVEALVAIASARLAAFGGALVLAAYRWWVPLLLTVAWLASHRWDRREAEVLVASLERAAPNFRRGEYFGNLALGAGAAKEVRVFSLAPWLVDGFRRHWATGMREAWHERRGSKFTLLRTGLVLIGAHALVLALLARAAVRGEIGVGSLAIYVQAVLVLSGLAWNAEHEYVLAVGTAPLLAARRLEQTMRAPQSNLPGHRPARPPRREIRFDGVTFRYPGSDRAVLRDLDLLIPVGRSLAIVGDNGSGKTTLIKLLCRLYDPDAGAVRVDGVDLRDVDAKGWQRSIAAVFQDLARYPLSLEDNVVLGCPERTGDVQARDAASRAAGLEALPSTLPAGWATPLSRLAPGGVDLSGGQWQRVALARALFAVSGGAGLLVLDEPTASLDVRAEADFYDRFLELTRGLTTIIVSHRFSTVRQADRIVVLERGRVVEAGSHDDLLALGRRYAAMWSLQAQHYRDPTRV